MRSPFDPVRPFLIPDPWLPSVQVASDMIRWGLDNLAWLYLSKPAPDIAAECQTYLRNLNGTGTMCTGLVWLGYFLSLLSLILHHTPLEVANAWGIAGQSVELPQAEDWANSRSQILRAP